MAGTIDLENLFNYANQTRPAYILKDNTGNNVITDEGATLGRVLFYDKKLSLNNSVSCGSCHKQEFAFADTAIQSDGFNGGVTGRHSMRLINARFSIEDEFFWDKRAASLEEQTTMPIQDHIEMGFSDSNGQPDLDSLLRKMQKIEYYNTLFSLAFGDSVITETRIQNALAQFVRSIQSFDSKYDVGRAQVRNEGDNFPNFTAEENLGKRIFLDPPPQGGAGCQGCHGAPEFDIDPNSLNNGVIRVAGSNNQIDLTNTRAPSLRDVFNPNGELNSPLMHNGNFTTMLGVINHYDSIVLNPNNTNLDPRLMAGPNGQNLQLTQNEKAALIAFLKTLSGNNVYTDEKWSDPFDVNGEVIIQEQTVSLISSIETPELIVYPNPGTDNIWVDGLDENFDFIIYDMNGRAILSERNQTPSNAIDISLFKRGNYIILINTGKTVVSKRVLKL